MIQISPRLDAMKIYFYLAMWQMILLISITTGVAAASQTDTVLQQSSISRSEAIAVARPHQALYVELLGNGIFYSLNYEHRVSKHIALRGGGGWMKSSEKRYYTSLLLMAMYTSSDEGHAFEFGVGGVGVGMKEVNGTNHFGMAGAFAMGYRYQPSGGGMIFRVTYTPFVYKRYSLSDAKIIYWRSMVGISLGYAF